MFTLELSKANKLIGKALELDLTYNFKFNYILLGVFFFLQFEIMSIQEEVIVQVIIIDFVYLKYFTLFCKIVNEFKCITRTTSDL